MPRIPAAVAVASLDTHRLIVAVPNEGPAEMSCNLPRSVAADVLRQLADKVESPCPAHAPDAEEQPPALTPGDVRDALAFNADEYDQALAALRDVLLDTTTTRTPEQALAAARILLAAHGRQLAALIDAERTETRARWGLNRGTRGLLTGYSNVRKTLLAYATSLDDAQEQPA
ncbi:hypothetical protein ACWEV4_02505 [Streptomyces sp. NPDC003860]